MHQVRAPRGWRKLWNQAQQERDPARLDAIIKQMNALLTEQEKKAADQTPVTGVVAPTQASGNS